MNPDSSGQGKRKHMQPSSREDVLQRDLGKYQVSSARNQSTGAAWSECGRPALHLQVIRRQGQEAKVHQIRLALFGRPARRLEPPVQVLELLGEALSVLIREP